MRTRLRGSTDTADMVYHVFVQDSSSTTGAGLTGLAHSDFTCRYIRSGEAMSGEITPETIATIGTYAAPTANTNIRIREVSAASMPGWYEVQIHEDWLADATAHPRSLSIHLAATGAAILPLQIQLGLLDPQFEPDTEEELVAAIGTDLGTTISDDLAETMASAEDVAAVKAVVDLCATSAEIAAIDTLIDGLIASVPTTVASALTAYGTGIPADIPSGGSASKSRDVLLREIRDSIWNLVAFDTTAKTRKFYNDAGELIGTKTVTTVGTVTSESEAV